MSDISLSRTRWGAALVLGAFLLFVIAGPPARAKETQGFVDDAAGYQKKGNLKAAEIELRNAVREAPQDPHVRAGSPISCSNAAILRVLSARLVRHGT
jgi:hypothetical protein